MTTGIPLSANTLAANGEPRYASRLYLPRYQNPLKRAKRYFETNPPCTAKIAMVGIPPYLYREFFSDGYHVIQSMHQRFLQHLRDKISFMGVVERRNVEFELVGDLRKGSGHPSRSSSKTSTHTNEVIKIDWRHMSRLIRLHHAHRWTPYQPHSSDLRSNGRNQKALDRHQDFDGP